MGPLLHRHAASTNVLRSKPCMRAAASTAHRPPQHGHGSLRAAAAANDPDSSQPPGSMGTSTTGSDMNSITQADRNEPTATGQNDSSSDWECFVDGSNNGGSDGSGSSVGGDGRSSGGDSGGRGPIPNRGHPGPGDSGDSPKHPRWLSVRGPGSKVDDYQSCPWLLLRLPLMLLQSPAAAAVTEGC